MHHRLTREGSPSLRSPVPPGSASGADTLASSDGSRLSRWAPLLLVLTALGVGACGGSDDRRFDVDGFAITFEYPEGFEESDDVTINEQEGSQAEETRAVGLDNDNGIIVQRYALRRRIDEENLDLAKSEFDGLVAALAPDAAKGDTTELAGFPALRYSDVPVRSVERGQSRLIVLFDGRTEYLINCQSTPEKRGEINDACDLAVDTLERKG
jgi:hypothetical protein